MDQKKIKDIVHQYSKKYEISGLAVLTIKNNKSHTSFIGTINRENTNSINEYSLFEIGSITKLFTNILLEKVFENKKISLETTISNILPKMKSIGDITVHEIITHKSNLPRLPKNLIPKNINNPYKEYARDDLEIFFETYINDNKEKKFEYSNLGYALLTYILEKIEGAPYEEILKKYILEPLKMERTYTHIPEECKKFLTQGHNTDGNEATLWDQLIFVGAGGIISNISDMEKFLRWNMEKNEPLPALMNQGEAFWHNGITGGYSSFLVFNKKIGLVILTNTAKPIDDLAKEIFTNLK